MPDLVDLYKRASARGLEILAITTETPAERPKIDAFIKTFGLPFPVLYADGLDKQYGVNGLPTTIGIDRAGHVRYRSEG
jgi:peroxiredoxin